jgi:error-prone DNA polymerase
MPDVYDRYRPFVRGSPFLLVRGRIERSGPVVNVRVHDVAPLRPERPMQQIPARDFR